MPEILHGIKDVEHLEPAVTSETVEPMNPKERVTFEYVERRVLAMKANRKKKLTHGKSIEDIWQEVDKEYPPHELGNVGGNRKMLVADDELGMRGRFVRIGRDDDWQSNHASPDLYVKVNSALSILIDQNPEAVFEPTSKKYEENTRLAQANWEQSWSVSGGKRELKLMTFNMARYGIGFMKTSPKLDIRTKLIRSEYHQEDSSKDVYYEKKIVRYNGLARVSLNPWTVWVDETAKPGHFDEIGDWYHECEMSAERFLEMYPVEKYPESAACIPTGTTERPVENERVEDSVNDTGDTGEPGSGKVIVGYYENCIKDIYAIIVPARKKMLYASPLPNDEGILSLTFAPWSLRSDETIYGIGLFEIVRGDTIMYDKMSNMTVDQLVLSIYKSFFYKGIDQLGEDGTLRIKPGEGQAVSDPQSMKWLEVPSPGAEAWKGLQFLQERRDINSGVPQQLAGKFSAKTLGQDLQAKEAALERLKLPLDFIVDALEQEAYITLSWLQQILSTPEVLEYTTAEELVNALTEVGLSEEEIHGYLDVLQKGGNDQELFTQQTMPVEDGQEGMSPQVKTRANVYPDVGFNLDKDEGGNLFENESRKFYRFGLDLPLKRLNWKGMIRIIPQSVLVPSKELTRRLDLDLFNLIYPSIQAMLAAPKMIPALIHPIKQIIESFGKDPQDWLDEKFLMNLHAESMKPVDSAGAMVKPSLTLQFSDMDALSKEGMPKKMTEAQKETLEKFYGIKIEEPLFVGADGQGPQSAARSGALPSPTGEGGDSGVLPPEMSTKSGVEAPQVADIGQAPHRMEGAVEASNRIV